MTENNWFSTTLADRTKDNLCEFGIILNPYTTVSGTFKDNCNALAKKLYNQHEKLYICYSGGLDSEFVIKVFDDLKLPVTPVIIKTPYNHNELNYAFEFCKDRSIKYELLEFSEQEILTQFYNRTRKYNLYSFLGCMPLIVCDMVNQAGGKLLTGYGDPFKITNRPTDTVPTTLEFSEWDYYLDLYDNSHPSGFFTYSLAVLYSFVNEINYSITLQQAKSILYGLKPRSKIYWDKRFYQICAELKYVPIKKYNYSVPKDTLLTEWQSYLT
jgi:hypothetical protein